MAIEFFPCGHPASETNSYVTGKYRRCLACKRAVSRDGKAQKRRLDGCRQYGDPESLYRAEAAAFERVRKLWEVLRSWQARSERRCG
jgi:hypothetical protein